MLEKDVILSKISIIKNCLNSIEKYSKDSHSDKFLTLDAITLNLQRAIQATIDIAHMLISQKGLKLPATYKESFEILAQHKLISNELKDKLVKMAGFRNIAVHEYQEIKPEIIESIIRHHLIDFDEFIQQVHSIL